MGISIDKLQFDPSAPADNQRVGSFLIGAAGTVITETGTALDVNISNASIAISATNLDIRDLVFATDKVDVSGSVVALDAPTLAALENISVSVGSEYLEDSAHASGDKGSYSLSVRSDIPSAATSANGDYASLLSDNKGRLWVNDAANAGQSYGALSITSTAAEFLGSPLAGRKLLLLQNLGSKDVFIGFDSSVTSSNGLMLAKHSSIELPFGDNLDVFMITASGTADVRYIQLA